MRDALPGFDNWTSYYDIRNPAAPTSVDEKTVHVGAIYLKE